MLNNTSDFISGFWSVYITIVVLVSILGCGVFLFMQDRGKTSAGNTMGHVWDETLQEYNNPLPNWWRWMFYISIIFSLIYLVIYPGLGSSPGKAGWSMRDSYDEEMKAADATHGPLFNRYLSMDIKAVAADPQARAIGNRLYLNYCANCHGSDAKGTQGFPNLADHVWLWGGTPAKIEETITNGRIAVMPAKGVKPDMDAEQVRDVVAYARSLAGFTHDSLRAQRGKVLFAQACSACHGPDGLGNQDFGYPNLTVADAGSRIYGATESSMLTTVNKGRQNQMPAFGEFLGPAKVHLLAAYIWGLGGGVSESSKAVSILDNGIAKLYFASGQNSLDAIASSVISDLVKLAAKNGNTHFQISGFHDATGNQSANQVLAKERAQSVSSALQAAGVQASNITMVKPQETTGDGSNDKARRVEVSFQ